MSRYRPLVTASLTTVLAILCVVLGLPAAYAAPAPAVDGAWTWPLQPAPEVTRYFDPPAAPWGAGHRGVDLAGSTGQSVVAAGPGTVAFVGVVAGRPVISIEHASGLRTTYEPVQSMLAAGDVVQKGQQIGTLLAGHAGCPANACVHWGLRRGEVYLNPLILVGDLRVRLLPIEDGD